MSAPREGAAVTLPQPSSPLQKLFRLLRSAVVRNAPYLLPSKVPERGWIYASPEATALGTTDVIHPVRLDDIIDTPCARQQSANNFIGPVPGSGTADAADLKSSFRLLT